MQECFQAVIMLLLLMVFYQIYCFSVSRRGMEKQKRCQFLGVVYFSFGVLSLVSRHLLLVMGGTVLLMLGLRLIAHGLDRADKRIFIDRYTGSESPGAEEGDQR